jgi:hypothetical protein
MIFVLRIGIGQAAHEADWASRFHFFHHLAERRNQPLSPEQCFQLMSDA